jgi:two-component system sensor histidine kinase YesM
MVATANVLCDDQNIIEVLEKESPTTKQEHFLNYKTIESRIASISSSSLIPYNADIFILGENDEIYSSVSLIDYQKAIQQIKQRKEKEIKDIGYYILWIAPMEAHAEFSGFSNSIALAKTINSSTSEVLGVVIINLYIDKNIQRIFASNFSDTSDEILLLNDNYELIYSTKEKPTSIENSITSMMTGSYGSLTSMVSNEEKLINYQTISRTNWKLVQLSSYHQTMRDILLLRNNTIVVNALFFMVSIIMAGIFANYIAKPMHELCELMGKLPEGNFDIRMTERRGNGEISQLSRGFNKMVNQTEELFLQLEHSYKVRENLRLEALRSQINPHFLFNTLNSIKWMATMHGDNQVSQMIASLGNLLQNTLADNEEMVSVEKEISCIHDYVIIQKMRFGERFKIVYDIPQELMSFQVPLFIFQPIVENSILHAFDEDETGGEIVIKAYMEKDKVIFEIKDNGKGMSPSVLSGEIDDNSKLKGKFSKIGIKNVDERIKMIYGDDYGLKVESVLNQGTTVFLTFPYLKEEINDQGLNS